MPDVRDLRDHLAAHASRGVDIGIAGGDAQLRRADDVHHVDDGVVAGDRERDLGGAQVAVGRCGNGQQDAAQFQ